MATESPLKCPVCGSVAKRDVCSDYYWGTVEEYIECPKGHYAFEMSYGAYRECVGDQEWTWSYNSPREEVFRASAEIKAAVAALSKREGGG